jgi:hypothetical protein
VEQAHRFDVVLGQHSAYMVEYSPGLCRSMVMCVLSMQNCFQDVDTAIYKGNSRTPAVLAGSDSSRKWIKSY